MICPNCGCNNNDNYCIKCGTLVNENGINKIKVEYKEDINNQLEKILGHKFNVFVSRPRNYAAGFFGPFYLIYRRCYIEGIFLFILTYISFILLMPFLTVFKFIILYIFHFLFYVMFTNHYYVEKMKKKLALAKTNKTKLGQTNIIAVAIFLAFIYFIFIIYLFFK